MGNVYRAARIERAEGESGEGISAVALVSLDEGRAGEPCGHCRSSRPVVMLDDGEGQSLLLCDRCSIKRAVALLACVLESKPGRGKHAADLSSLNIDEAVAILRRLLQDAALAAQPKKVKPPKTRPSLGSPRPSLGSLLMMHDVKSALPHRPAYTRDFESGEATTTIKGKTWLLGEHGSADSRELYEILLWEAYPMNLKLVRTKTKLAMLCDLYSKHAGSDDDRRGTKLDPELAEPICTRLASMFGSTLAAMFNFRKFKAVRQSWVDEGVSAATLEVYADAIIEVFRWGAEEDLATPNVIEDLALYRRAVSE